MKQLRRGRPYRTDGRTVPLRVRLSANELKLAYTAAKLNQQNIGDFVRDAILCAAEDCLERPTSPPKASSSQLRRT